MCIVTAYIILHNRYLYRKLYVHILKRIRFVYVRVYCMIVPVRLILYRILDLAAETHTQL